MSKKTTERARATSAYAGLDFIKAAFCPLDFRAMKFSEHPEFHQFRKDTALGTLEVGNSLHYPRQFPFTDAHGNRKTGTQIVTAAFASPVFRNHRGLHRTLIPIVQTKPHQSALSMM
jgi:hypothetical protein